MPRLLRAAPIARAALALGWAAGVSLQALAPASAQTAPAAAPPGDSWQSCAATQDAVARLACFDTWAQRQQATPAGVAAPGTTPAPAPTGSAGPSVVTSAECRDRRYSQLSRFWELEPATDCGTFELRSYRPISLSVAALDSINNSRQLTAPNPSSRLEGEFRTAEVRLRLSARLKVASDLLTAGDPMRSDSLWVAYSQQSYLQLFATDLSRPIRTTDYKPEVMYVYPPALQLPGGWRFSYAGLGLSHQSNGQQPPLSRSWNRAYVMAGLEWRDRFSLEARVWERVFQTGTDDNPGISNFIGRGELKATWHVSPLDTLAATLRHNLRSSGRGSARLEYFRSLEGDGRRGRLGDLRLYAQLFSGYGDSLIDYNRKRTVISLGLALVDW